MLWASLVLTTAFVVFEAIAGIRSGSLALLSDAGHNFTDAFGLMLAALGFAFQSRPGNQFKTFGYQRTGVLAAFVNALTLVLLSAWLLYESYMRFLHPEPVADRVMIIVAAVGLVLNLGIALGLSGHGSDLNIRAAWIHMAGDAAACIAIHSRRVGSIAELYHLPEASGGASFTSSNHLADPDFEAPSPAGRAYAARKCHTG